MHKHDMESVEVTKGNTIIGVNYFCRDMNCRYEYDTGKRG